VNPDLPHGPPPILWIDWLARTTFGILIGAAALFAGWCMVLPALLLTGWLGLYQYTASPFLRRGISFSRQFHLIYRCKGWFPYMLICGILTSVPFLNLIMLAPLVAAGTLLVAASDDRLQRA